MTVGNSIRSLKTRPSPFTKALLKTLARTLKSVATAACAILSSGSEWEGFIAAAPLGLFAPADVEVPFFAAEKRPVDLRYRPEGR